MGIGLNKNPRKKRKNEEHRTKERKENKTRRKNKMYFMNENSKGIYR